MTAAEIHAMNVHTCSECGDKIDRHRLICDRCIAKIDNMLQAAMEGMNEGESGKKTE